MSFDGKGLWVRLAMAVAIALTIGQAQAQSQFSPVIRVNDSAITQYEIEQRVLFLEFIRTQGNLDERARESLIDERLQVSVATAFGLTATPEEIQTEMQEFAQRGNLTLEQMVELLRNAGVAAESFQAFSGARATWRKLIGARFASQVQISEAEIDRAMSLTTGAGGLRVLLSELILPVAEGQADATMALAQELSRNLTDRAAFERAAKRYSASPTGSDGGRLDWIDISRLSPQIASVVLGMAPGEVSPPLQLGNAVALFQMRALSEGAQTATPDAALEYAVLRLPEGDRGAQQLARIRQTADTCDDLYGLLPGASEAEHTRETRAPADISAADLRALQLLDAGEFTPAMPLANGGGTRMLMLCGRSAVVETQENRIEIANRLRGQRIDSLAESFLAELRASAVIEDL